MISALNREWHGVLALIWLLCGLGVAIVIERFVDELVLEYFSIMWVFAGWLGPAFLLAISGFRRGNIANRVCGALVLVAFAALLVLIIWASLTLRNHRGRRYLYLLWHDHRIDSAEPDGRANAAEP